MSKAQATSDPSSKQAIWRLWWREARRQVAYLAVTTAAIGLLAFALGVVAVVLQVSRDETRNVDVALVVAPAVPPATLADHAFELYRRGYAPTLLLAGEGQAGLKAQLVERGVPEASLLSGAAGPAATPQLQRLLREVRDAGATTMLVVALPDELLRTLKLARDQGVRAYASPTPAAALEPLSLFEASLRYWRYVLVGQ